MSPGSRERDKSHNRILLAPVECIEAPVQVSLTGSHPLNCALSSLLQGLLTHLCVRVEATVSKYERRARQATSRLLHSGIKSTITVEPRRLGISVPRAFPRRAFGNQVSRWYPTVTSAYESYDQGTGTEPPIPIPIPIPDLPGIGGPSPPPSPICGGSGIIPIPGSHRGFRALLTTSSYD
jgi:hypothetical protein